MTAAGGSGLLSGLALGHSIHLTEVPLPKGVDFVARLKADNPVVVTVQVPREIVVEEPTAEAAAAAPTTEIISEKPEAAAGAAAAGAAAAADKEKKEPAK